MSELPRPRPELLQLDPYVQGKSGIAGIREPVKLSSNESAYGPSPRAIEAYHAAAARIHRYPDGSQTELRHAIAATHGLAPGRVVCGNGSEELIGLLIRSYVGAGEELLLSENHFMMCSIYGRIQGASLQFAPEHAGRVSVEALLERVTERTRMVAIANPNNPTGTLLERAQIARLHAGLPSHVLLLLDGAYAEYVEDEDFDAGVELAAGAANVVMTRTFSKIYGLAGLRIGWAYCPEHVLEILQRIRTPFNASTPAMAAAAAAVRDVEYVREIRARNGRELRRIRGALLDLGLHVLPSATNFYLVDFGGRRGKSALAAARFLESRGVIPRPVRSGASDQALRITVGLPEENDQALAALAAYVVSRCEEE